MPQLRIRDVKEELDETNGEVSRLRMFVCVVATVELIHILVSVLI